MPADGRPRVTDDPDGRPTGALRGDLLLARLYEIHGQPRYDLYNEWPRTD